MTTSYYSCYIQRFEKKCRVRGKKWGRFRCCLLRPEVGQEKGLGKELGRSGLFFFGHVIGCFYSAVFFLVCAAMVMNLVEVAVTLFSRAN